MYCTKEITQDLYWVGVNDRRITLFENVYPLSDGVTYNAYLLRDEKTVLFDTSDSTSGGRFFENVEHVLAGRTLDYIIVHHMEPDHSAMLKETLLRYKNAKIVCSEKARQFITQFFEMDTDSIITVKEGDTLNTGNHELTFLMAPMVHWPEVMVTYDKTSKVLFSADAFGTFGALSGSIFADDYDFERRFLFEARRYYTNIVGKYGDQVSSLLKKASAVDIGIICPLHGPVWRENLSYFIDKYIKWGSYTPEEKGVLIVYGSVYGNTENAAEIFAGCLSEEGVRNIELRDASRTDVSFLLPEAFRMSHTAIFSATYNAGVFTPVAEFLEELKTHNFRSRTVAVAESGSWALSAGKHITDALSRMKDIRIAEPRISFKSSPKGDTLEAMKLLAKEFAKDIL